MFKKKIIRVEFIDTESGELIGYDEQSVKKLPEAFEYKTEVAIGGDKFVVVKATPDTRKKFKKTGSLVLELEKIQLKQAAANESDNSLLIEEAVEYASSLPSEKVYQTASRADLFPAFTGKKEGKDLIVMGSWEWRQLEFVIGDQEEIVLQEFNHIREIRKKHGRTEAGRVVYSRQHRRSGIGNPFKTNNLSSKNLRETYFPFSIQHDGLTFMAAEGFADGGFAIKTQSGVELYGLEFGEKVSILSMRCPDKLSSEEEQHSSDLSAFMDANGLILVDWTQDQIIRSSEIKEYLRSNIEQEAAIEEESEAAEITSVSIGAGLGPLSIDLSSEEEE